MKIERCPIQIDYQARPLRVRADDPIPIVQDSDACLYTGQHTYAGGALLCTSAALHWLLACMLKGKTDFSNKSQIDCIMRWAVRQCGELVGRHPQMLTQVEVLTHRPLPRHLHSVEYNGHVIDISAEEEQAFGRVVHMHRMHMLMPPGSGCMVTANKHTVAVYRTDMHEMWIFDSLVAVELRLQVDKLSNVLQECLGYDKTCGECNITFIWPSSLEFPLSKAVAVAPPGPYEQDRHHRACADERTKRQPKDTVAKSLRPGCSI